MSEATHIDVTNGDAYVGNPDAVAKAQNERTGQNTVIKMGLGAVGLASMLPTGIPQDIAHVGIDAANSGKEMVQNFAGHSLDKLDSSEPNYQIKPDKIIIGSASVYVTPDSELLGSPINSRENRIDWKDAHLTKKEIVDGKSTDVPVKGVEYGATVKLGNPGIVTGKGPNGEEEQFLQIPRLDAKGEATFGYAPLGKENSHVANIVTSFDTINAIGKDTATGDSHTVTYDKLPPAQISVVSVEPTQ